VAIFEGEIESVSIYPFEFRLFRPFLFKLKSCEVTVYSAADSCVNSTTCWN